jgi:tRNA (guanine-N1)-methyltransferase
MQLDVVTLFPEWFGWFREQRHVRNAVERGHELRALNPRDHTPLRANQVDDTPFGGGAGMVLRVDVMDAALRGFYDVDPVDLKQERRVIALTPGGRTLDEGYVNELAAEPAITLLCGRYEGFDERIVQHFASDTLSVGRYVLSGGELAAMVVCDAVLRKLPRTPRSRSRSATRSAATPSTRTTRVRRSTAAGRSRTCSCRVTTRRSRRGDGHAAGSAAPARAESQSGFGRLRPRSGPLRYPQSLAERLSFPAALRPLFS